MQEGVKLLGKHSVDLQKPKRREHKHNVKGNHKLQKEKKKYKNQLENKVLSGNKYISINNYFKCHWIKCSNQKTREGFSGGPVVENPPFNARDIGLMLDLGGSHMPQSN